MLPSRGKAIQELELAGRMNPGPWRAHSYNVANAARIIAEQCGGIDSEKAFACGLLHDIGRRTGIAAVRHIIDGYDYSISQGCVQIPFGRREYKYSLPADLLRYSISKALRIALNEHNSIVHVQNYKPISS